eukprot:767937-Hanusia_phi.AAC.6
MGTMRTDLRVLRMTVLQAVPIVKGMFYVCLPGAVIKQYINLLQASDRMDQSLNRGLPSPCSLDFRLEL